VIASEFAAVSSILNGALRVNPWDVLMSVTTLDSALSMSESECEARRGRDIDFVSTCPSGLWTRNVLRDLNDATHEDSTKREAVGGSSPESVLARELELSLERLDFGSLEEAYKMTSKRVIIIDFNGTLVVKEPAGKYLKREILGTSGFKPSDIAAKALGKLCQDPSNIIYVVSGDSQQNLEMAVGDIAGLGLAASNGACFADPDSHKWTYLDFGVDWQAVQKVGEQYPSFSSLTS
jgi:trehalose 6-phosphate synthase/phosphatase